MNTQVTSELILGDYQRLNQKFVSQAMGLWDSQLVSYPHFISMQIFMLWQEYVMLN